MSGILGLFTRDHAAALQSGFAALAIRGVHQRWLLMNTGGAPHWLGSGSGPGRSLTTETTNAPYSHSGRVLSLGVCSHEDTDSHWAVATDQAWVVVFDGHLDNRGALLTALAFDRARATSCSDAELVGAAYAHWGSESFSRLDGSFTVALYDVGLSSVYLARDLCGTRPLYYSSTGDFAFASSTAGLFELLDRTPRVGTESAKAYLNGTAQSPEFDTVEQVLPGHWLKICLEKNSTRESSPYWRMPEACSFTSMAEAGETLRALLSRSIVQQARGKVGIALSSGVDSSAILACWSNLANSEVKPHTFTFVAHGPEIKAEWDEHSVARQMAASVGAEYQPVYLESEDVPAMFDALVDSMDLPFVGPVAIAQRQVFSEARAAGVNTLFGGHGPDILLGGGTSHVVARFRSLLRRGQLLRAVHFIKSASVANELPRLRLLRAALRSLGSTSMEDIIAGQLFQSVLPTALWIEEQNATAVGLDSRFPFLSRELVDFCFKLPMHYRVDGNGVGKALLRESMSAHLLPLILEKRGHVGFPVPVHSWLSQNVQAFEPLLEHASTLSFCDKSELQRLWQTSIGGDMASCYRIWRWLSLAAWASRRNVEFT